jgi:hypothetical protein
MAKGKTHMDNTQADAAMRMALCGWPTNETTTHADEVTCKSCLALLRARSMAAQHEIGLSKTDSIQRKLVEAFKASSIPSAGAPPLLNASVWPATCKGGEQRCHECALCEWERDAERWSSVSMYNVTHRPTKPSGSPKWPSMNAALIAFVEWKMVGPSEPSAMKGQIACIERGYLEARSSVISESENMRRAAEFVIVDKSLDLAYPENDQVHGLKSMQCRDILAHRTPGIPWGVTSYEELSERYAVGVGVLKSVVKRGRTVVSIELAARGLIPEPPPASGLFEQIAELRGKLVANG